MPRNEAPNRASIGPGSQMRRSKWDQQEKYFGTLLGFRIETGNSRKNAMTILIDHHLMTILGQRCYERLDPINYSDHNA